MRFLDGLTGVTGTSAGEQRKDRSSGGGEGEAVRSWRRPSPTSELWKAAEPIERGPGYRGGTRPHLPRNLAQGVAVHLTCEPGPFPPLGESLSVIWGRTSGEDRPLGPWSYLVSKGRIGVRGTKMVHQPSIPSEVTMNTLLSS